MNINFTTFVDWLDKHPEVTMCGLAWAFFWRMTLMYIGFWMAFMLVIGVFGFLFEM